MVYLCACISKVTISHVTYYVRFSISVDCSHRYNAGTNRRRQGVTATVHNRVDTVVAFLILTFLDVVDDMVYDRYDCLPYSRRPWCRRRDAVVWEVRKNAFRPTERVLGRTTQRTQQSSDSIAVTSRDERKIPCRPFASSIRLKFNKKPS